LKGRRELHAARITPVAIFHGLLKLNEGSFSAQGEPP
jgi:hypothetical protein